MQEAHLAPPKPAFDEIAAVFREKQRFLVTTHVNPDGDGLGAELGLWAYLREQGKDVRIVNADPLAPRYDFLGREGAYETYDPAEHEAFIAGCDVVIVLDISNWGRLGALGERLEKSTARKICIDHHPFENNGMADLYAVDLSASATGQLVYEMIRDWGHPVDKRMAMGFYISILTDTGSFRFSNSDSRAHQAAGELIDRGLDPNTLYENVYGNSSLARVRLMGSVLSNMRSEDGDRVLIMEIPLALRKASGAKSSDTEGFVDIARTVVTCEGVALLVEREDGMIKASLRSRGRINVNRVAREFDGGGHQYASGATLPGPLSQASDAMLRAMRAEVAKLPQDS